MPKFSSSKLIDPHFHVKNYKRESSIGYDMIIDHDLMVKLGLTTDFKHKVLQWDGETVPMKEPSGLLGKSDLNKHEMREVVMKTVEPASTIEATVRLVKTLSSTYAKTDLKQLVDNTTRLNADERTQLLRLLKYFEDLFDGNLGD